MVTFCAMGICWNSVKHYAQRNVPFEKTLFGYRRFEWSWSSSLLWTQLNIGVQSHGSYQDNMVHHYNCQQSKYSHDF